MRNPPEFPNAASLAGREALKNERLQLTRGALPKNLSGHLFVIAPSGSVDSGGAPYPNHNDRPTLINGDGMVWRFDFDDATGARAPGVRVSSELVKPPDFYYDELTRDGQSLDFAGFNDLGMMRVSLFLGMRNFANTAFLPLTRPGEAPRMLCCYDAGPPVEIDPVTLQTLGVVGSSWDPEALDGLVAFPPILSTAHPMYDPDTGDVFAVNYGRSTLSMLESIPFFERLAFLPERAKRGLGRALGRLAERAPLVPVVTSLASRALAWLANAKRGLEPLKPGEFIPKDFLDLVVWPGHGDITRLRVIDMANGQPAVVEQSMHQIAITRRFVLLMDTNFKLRFDQFYNNPFGNVPGFEPYVRSKLASQQGGTSNFWVIRRVDVDHALASGAANPTVPAWKVPVRGAVHFLADFDDSDGIRIHCAHGNALDIAEWVRSDDRRLGGQRVRHQMHGMPAATVDVNELGQYVIDPIRRRVVDARRIANDKLWGLALYAARNVPAWDRIPERLTHVFWFSGGLWEDTYTDFIRNLYRSYGDRLIPAEDIDKMIERGGMPSTLVCVNLDCFHLTDSYTFPRGVSLSSPQFIPDPARRGDRGGWISTVVWNATTSSLWIFDAENLSQGPIAELAVPGVLGFSLHTAWLPSLEARPATAACHDHDDGDGDAGSRGRRVDPAQAMLERLSHLNPRARRRIEEMLLKRTRPKK